MHTDFIRICGVFCKTLGLFHKCMSSDPSSVCVILSPVFAYMTQHVNVHKHTPVLDAAGAGAGCAEVSAGVCWLSDR